MNGLHTPIAYRTPERVVSWGLDSEHVFAWSLKGTFIYYREISREIHMNFSALTIPRTRERIIHVINENENREFRRGINCISNVIRNWTVRLWKALLTLYKILYSLIRVWEIIRRDKVNKPKIAVMKRWKIVLEFEWWFLKLPLSDKMNLFSCYC